MGNCCIKKNEIKEIIVVASRQSVIDMSNVNPLRDSQRLTEISNGSLYKEPLRTSIQSTSSNINDVPILMINFKDMKNFSSFPRYPDNKNICIDIKNIERATSLFIYISHNWLRNWDGSEGWTGIMHPDNDNNDKFQLMIEAIEHIKQTFAKNMNEIYIWIDFSCLNQDDNPAKELNNLDNIIQFCDFVLTPIVDNACSEWELTSTEAGWLTDYKAKTWNFDEKSYVNRSWCRLEMLYCMYIPLYSDINDRIYKCQSALAHAMLANRRPHFIFGSKEKEENRGPICLPVIKLDDYKPSEGFVTNLDDKSVIDDLLKKLQPHINEKGQITKSGYIGDKNDNNQKHGKGKLIYSDGAVFSGEFRDDMRFNGVLVTASGEVYVGEFANDLKNGNGKCTFTDGSMYEGQWLNDKRHGAGTYNLANGDKYVGEFENGMRSGEGSYFSKGKLTYEGTYLQNKRSGKGRTYWADGRIYDGFYKNDKMHGHGTLTYTEGVYTGEFVDNKRSGHGKYLFENGDSHEGQYLNDKRNGIGKFFYKATNTTFEGMYKDGKRNGIGKVIWPDGRFYEGDFKDDKREGKGLYKWPTGAYYDGMFKDGKRNGSGKYVDANGRIQNGRWKDDKFIS